MLAERDKTTTSTTRARAMKALRDDPFRQLVLGVRFDKIRLAHAREAMGGGNSQRSRTPSCGPAGVPHGAGGAPSVFFGATSWAPPAAFRAGMPATLRGSSPTSQPVRRLGTKRLARAGASSFAAGPAPHARRCATSRRSSASRSEAKSFHAIPARAPPSVSDPAAARRELAHIQFVSATVMAALAKQPTAAAECGRSSVLVTFSY